MIAALRYHRSMADENTPENETAPVPAEDAPTAKLPEMSDDDAATVEANEQAQQEDDDGEDLSDALGDFLDGEADPEEVVEPIVEVLQVTARRFNVRLSAEFVGAFRKAIADEVIEALEDAERFSDGE